MDYKNQQQGGGYYNQGPPPPPPQNAYYNQQQQPYYPPQNQQQNQGYYQPQQPMYYNQQLPPQQQQPSGGCLGSCMTCHIIRNETLKGMCILVPALARAPRDLFVIILLDCNDHPNSWILKKQGEIGCCLNRSNKTTSPKGLSSSMQKASFAY
ncbi:hypothetical protein MUCCIDRAFT_161215 [Mucor lusitanicus CBS 277.49]|uniref:Uncharacterized protein n=1 Tax=Mucor lusitanicus CBS 277.49 TaxID=747725 RepID=A0A168M6X3_MUCCL|nr:hypothetical protein MUCCIDRAFT_161215 [Mucor lusitanicus CBS 277.49]